MPPVMQARVSLFSPLLLMPLLEIVEQREM